MTCNHRHTEYRAVTFRNGTKHVQIICPDCNKKMGFAPRSGIDLDILPKGMTTCEERIANGQMVDCFGCGKVKPRITGFCKQCEKKGLHLPFRIALKDTGITIWDLSREEVYDIAVQAELDKSIK